MVEYIYKCIYAYMYRIQTPVYLILQHFHKAFPIFWYVIVFQSLNEA